MTLPFQARDIQLQVAFRELYSRLFTFACFADFIEVQHPIIIKTKYKYANEMSPRSLH